MFRLSESRRFRIAAPALALVALTALVAAGCAKKEETPPAAEKSADTTHKALAPAPTAQSTMPLKPATPPDHVQVQHVLIGFAGSIPHKHITRTRDAAKKLAYEILERARKGADFDSLVVQYTDDQPPGIYGLANTGVKAAEGEFGRDQMVKGFTDMAFDLSPGNIGIADYDAKTSPYGWHIIRRLK